MQCKHTGSKATVSADYFLATFLVFPDAVATHSDKLGGDDVFLAFGDFVFFLRLAEIVAGSIIKLSEEDRSLSFSANVEETSDGGLADVAAANVGWGCA